MANVLILFVSTGLFLFWCARSLLFMYGSDGAIAATLRCDFIRMRRLLLGMGIMMSPSLFAASSIHDFTLNSIDGSATPLSSFKGKVVLLVNVASFCGYTPQYEGLEALYKKYKDRGLVVLGFPANNFGEQEPGTNEEIKKFCSTRYHVGFPMFSKVSVVGGDKTPLYQFLTDKRANPLTGGEIQWNFTKFLADRNGKAVARFESAIEPDSAEVIGAIEKALKQ